MTETLVRTEEPTPGSLLVASLPESKYTENFQPTYHDQDHLVDTVDTLLVTEGVTKPEYVDELAQTYADIAVGKNRQPLLILRSCNEPIVFKDQPDTGIGEIVSDVGVTLVTVAASGLRKARLLLRMCGQSNKPRSKEFEEVTDEETGRKISVVSYMGDMVNRKAIDQREPDAGHMMDSALQARDVSAAIERDRGTHISMAHETLLLPYEKSFIRRQVETGRQYLLSADMPWIGVRTNAPDSEQVEMLRGIENPVGIKIGAGTNAEHIKGLADALNPDQRAGKLVFMLRLGIDKHHELPELLTAIQEHAPNSLIMYDIHGSTKPRADGKKVRLVSDIIDEIQLLAVACRKAGTRLHGLHLETMNDPNRKECVDFINEEPEEGDIDPRLNPEQTKRVLDATAPYLLAI